VDTSVGRFGLGCCSFRGGASRMDEATARIPDPWKAGLPCYGRGGSLSLSLSLGNCRIMVAGSSLPGGRNHELKGAVQK
jgi:hypothetical protein